MKKRFISRGVFAVISCILAVALTFAAGGSSMSEEARQLVSTDIIDFKSGNEATFCIVRPDDSNEDIGAVAINVFKSYKEIYGVAPKQVTDIDGTENTREILIGECDREATAKAKELLAKEGSGKDCDYIICSVGDDIVIYGNCATATAEAGQAFASHFLLDSQKEGIYYAYHGTNHPDGLNVCSISDLSRFTVVRPIYNVSYLTQNETERLCEILYKKTGYSVDIVNDNIAKENPDITARGGILEKTGATEYEIIIGNCDREGVNKLNKVYQYEIRIEDKKIYLNGGSPYATTMAVSEFCRMVENNSSIDASMSVLNGSYSSASKNYDASKYYKPVWWDEFDRAQIDTTKWNVVWDVQSGVSLDGKPCRRGSSELQNNYVEDGCLVIAAAKTDDAYYGGMLKTDTTMEFLYGYLEISNIHPNGNGFWTAFWSNSKYTRYNRDMWYNETGISENWGSGMAVVQTMFAWPTPYCCNKLGLEGGYGDTINQVVEYQAKDSRGLWMDFHTYGFEWIDNTHIRFTVDGYITRDVEIKHEELQKVYSQYLYLKLSMANGFERRGPVTEDEWEWENSNKLITDWVYLYQLDGHGSIRH